jgi:hypothetical protein
MGWFETDRLIHNPTVHHYLMGKIDAFNEQATRKQVEKGILEGSVVAVHHHRHGEPCVDACEVHWAERK